MSEKVAKEVKIGGFYFEQHRVVDVRKMMRKQRPVMCWLPTGRILRVLGKAGRKQTSYVCAIFCKDSGHRLLSEIILQKNIGAEVSSEQLDELETSGIKKIIGGITRFFHPQTK